MFVIEPSFVLNSLKIFWKHAQESRGLQAQQVSSYIFVLRYAKNDQVTVRRAVFLEIYRSHRMIDILQEGKDIP